MPSVAPMLSGDALGEGDGDAEGEGLGVGDGVGDAEAAGVGLLPPLLTALSGEYDPNNRTTTR
ncbi:MAG: hypothetical protein M3T56_09350 [Chloroflexota bacterium]|nr:hypothetical protein [Chloroflexota bacterium]